MACGWQDCRVVGGSRGMGAGPPLSSWAASEADRRGEHCGRRVAADRHHPAPAGVVGEATTNEACDPGERVGATLNEAQGGRRRAEGGQLLCDSGSTRRESNTKPQEVSRVGTSADTDLFARP